MQHYVYELIDPRTQNVFYVGKGCRDRVRDHTRDARRLGPGEFGNRHLYHKIHQIWEAGKEVQHEIVFRAADPEDAFEREKELISEHGLGNLCNIEPGGEGPGERPQSVKDRISDSVSGWWDGISEEEREAFCQKLSESQQRFWNSERSKNERERRSELMKKMWKSGKISFDPSKAKAGLEAIRERLEEIEGQSYEEIYGEDRAKKIRQRISDAKSGEDHHFYGKKLSDETKQKISESVSGARNGNAKKYVVDCDGHTREFETRADVKEAVCKYNEENNLGRGSKIVYKTLFDEGKSKSWEIVDNSRKLSA